MSVRNPDTGRMIKTTGATFQNLLAAGYKYNAEKNILVAPMAHAKNIGAATTEITPRAFVPHTAEDVAPIAIGDNMTIHNIIHLADIHIPLDLFKNRQVEYETAFAALYSDIADRLLSREETICVIVGDLVNVKHKTENETIIMAQTFLKKLLEYAKYVIVCIGNHDFSDINPGRIDNITAICHALPREIIVLRNSGVYTLGNYTFVFNSLLDGKFIRRRDVPGENKCILLYHGTIDGADTGGKKMSRGVPYPTIAMIDDFDAALLGHIHQRQFVGRNAAYAGSLIQQKYTEDTDNHGYVLWVQLRPVLRDIVGKYVSVVCDLRDIDRIAATYAERKVRMRILSQAPREEFEAQRADILARHSNICHIEYKCTAPICARPAENTALASLLSPDAYTLYKEIAPPAQSAPRNIKFISMEFKNIFIYGNDIVNKISFENGVTTICAENATGKSSLIHMILYVLYDCVHIPVTRGGKSDVLHKAANDGYIIFNFTVNDELYRIEKNIIRKTSGQSAHTIKLFRAADDVQLNLENKGTEVIALLGCDKKMFEDACMILPTHGVLATISNALSFKKLLMTIYGVNHADAITAINRELRALGMSTYAATATDMLKIPAPTTNIDGEELWNMDGLVQFAIDNAKLFTGSDATSPKRNALTELKKQLAQEVPSIVLAQKYEGFARRVNEILSRYTIYTAHIAGDTFALRLVAQSGPELRPENLSGYESVVLNLAIIYAIKCESVTGVTFDFLALDEKLDCMDEKNYMQKIPQLIDIMRQYVGTIFIISHRDIPRDIIDAKLSITFAGSYSHL